MKILKILGFVIIAMGTYMVVLTIMHFMPSRIEHQYSDMVSIVETTSKPWRGLFFSGCIILLGYFITRFTTHHSRKHDLHQTA